MKIFEITLKHLAIYGLLLLAGYRIVLMLSMKYLLKMIIYIKLIGDKYIVVCT